ncbi:hypothetical protein C2G38_2273952 [Gigaspora rosea]|uniref:BTB domain-containing protein n=1 Tax=Gigaspora rosea TaxID=44941 RepID=A0A397VT25_9GLOM|nr:hypothetical protein C2G38_2273952 [Gigaspora rosea]
MLKVLNAGNETLYNNVSFNIKGQEIYANSLILICAAPYFEEIFVESSTNFNQTYNDIEPDSFRVFLRWLYGESLSQAMQNYEKEENRDIFFQICKDLLLASSKFNISTIKELIEYKLVTYIHDDLVYDNLEKVIELANEYELDDLFKYCEGLKDVIKDEADEPENSNIRVTKNNSRPSIINNLKLRFFKFRFFLKTRTEPGHKFKVIN